MKHTRTLALLSAALVALPAVTHAQGPISMGDTKRGVFVTGQTKASDGSYYDDWTFYATSGTRIVVTMRSSAFDTYLNVGRGTGSSFQSLASNDDKDGSSGTDSEISFTIPSAGQYTIRANSLQSEQTGNYTLSLASGGAASTVAQSSSSGTRTTTDYMRPIFNELMTWVEAQGGNIKFMIVSTAAERDAHTVMTLNVTEGTTYSVRGACDADCTDLDLALTDGNGKNIGSDKATDDHPVVTFKAASSGEVKVTATMATCKTAFCYYGVVASRR
jgi:hypothetical protein